MLEWEQLSQLKPHCLLEMNVAFSNTLQQRMNWFDSQIRMTLSMIREKPGRVFTKVKIKHYVENNEAQYVKQRSNHKQYPQSGQLPIAASCFSLYQLHFIPLTKTVPVIWICIGEKNNTGQWNTFHNFDAGNKDKALLRWQIKASNRNSCKERGPSGATDTVVKNCDVTSQ